MRIALDINRYVDLCKGVGETVTLLEEAEAVVLPFVDSASYERGSPAGDARRRMSERCDASS